LSPCLQSPDRSGFQLHRAPLTQTAKVEAVTAKITAAFSRDPPDLDEAKRLCVELKYWVGLEEAAKEKL
jgi:molecular chaperone HscB